MAGDLLNKWDADTNAATSLENLKQIEIDESQILDQAVQHHNKSAELMNIVQSAHPTSCVESASIMTKMAVEDLAVEIEKRDLLIQSDISTAAGVAQFRRAFAPLSAREHAIVDKKNAYMESAAYKNAWAERLNCRRQPSPTTGEGAMKIKYLALVWLTGFASVEAVAQSAPPTIKASAKSDQPTYIITAHTVAHDNSTNSQLDNYIIVYGSEVLKVQYSESQISTVKPGASRLEQVAPGKNLHLHFRYGVWPQEPDVSQVPQVGAPIRACEMDTKYPDNDGHPVIAIQSVSAPCMSRNGDTLHYSLAPNGGVRMWEYVNFDILEATSSVGVAAAQSAPLRKDIPAIAKAADGAIVTIITAINDKPIAQGTGFVVSADGVIATNYHVIKEGNVAIVKFPDDTAFSVDGVLAADKVRDLAIIKIHGKTFRALTLGNSDQVQVGEEVVAIGNPLSLESTVSNGIISGVRISKEQGGKFLQTTAPISPGSSGGPLFNMSGEVVGINTLYLEGGENLNFAIPVNDAKSLLRKQSVVLQNLPNEPATRTPIAKEKVPNTPPATTKEPRFSDNFVRAAIIAVNGLWGLDTSREDELLRDLQNVADLEKDKKLRTSERLGYSVIALEFDNVSNTKKVFLERAKQIVVSRSVSADDAIDLARREPEYKAVLQQVFACIETLKSQVNDGHLDITDDFCVGNLMPLTAYRQSVLCHISQDECGSQ